MEEGNNGVQNNSNDGKAEIFSKSVRAGKRTYFFDVKSTKAGDYYLTITESKKRFGDDGKFYYEKHKLFLYKEDFEKFAEGLNEAVGFIKKEQPYTVNANHTPSENGSATFSDVKFEDLGEK
ncbi:MAG: DUF3276 family protein [Bacteroidota bacterium]